MANTSVTSLTGSTIGPIFTPASNTVAGVSGFVGAEQINASSDYRVVTNQPTAFQTVAQVKANWNSPVPTVT